MTLIHVSLLRLFYSLSNGALKASRSDNRLCYNFIVGLMQLFQQSMRFSEGVRIRAI